METNSICESCVHFIRPIAATRVCPEEKAECGHPDFYALLTSTMQKYLITKCVCYKNRLTKQ